MASTTIKTHNKTIAVEANAYTLIIYEDRFKGRRLLKDIDNLVNEESISLATSARVLWAEAKTADNNIPDFCEFIKGLEMADLFKNHSVITQIILDSLAAVINPKKEKATVKFLTPLRQLRNWWQSQRSVD